MVSGCVAWVSLCEARRQSLANLWTPSWQVAGFPGVQEGPRATQHLWGRERGSLHCPLGKRPLPTCSVSSASNGLKSTPKP